MGFAIVKIVLRIHHKANDTPISSNIDAWMVNIYLEINYKRPFFILNE